MLFILLGMVFPQASPGLSPPLPQFFHSLTMLLQIVPSPSLRILSPNSALFFSDTCIGILHFRAILGC